MAYETITTGQLITANKLQEFQNFIVNVFASASARDSAITSPVHGQFAYLSDTDVLTFYNGSSWSSFIGEGDITAVTVNTNSNSGMSGGATATSGAFTSDLSVDANNLATTTAVSTDYVIVEDVTDNSTKKALVSDITSGYATETYVNSQGFADIGLIIALG